MARRDEGAYCLYVTEEQRSQPGCIRRESDRLSHSRALSIRGMIRILFCSMLLVSACSSSAGSPSNSSAAGDTSAACPNVAGTWNITAHCDPTLIGQTVVVTQSDCSLSFAAPFDGFTATAASDGKLTVSGPQTCSGTASSSELTLTCTPGTCVVKLSK
jgi:hypothetical protein